MSIKAGLSEASDRQPRPTQSATPKLILQFIKFVLLAVAVALPAAEACKCLGPKGHNQVQHTKRCCNRFNGSFKNKDCALGSISGHIREFTACCKDVGSARSDCHVSDVDGSVVEDAPAVEGA